MKGILLTPTLDARNGGIARSTPSLAKALAAHGVSVDLIFPKISGTPTDNGRDEGLTLHPLTEASDRSTWKNAIGLKSMLRERIHDGQGEVVLHHAGIWTALNHVSAVFASRHKIPLVCSPRGMLDDWSA